MSEQAESQVTGEVKPAETEATEQTVVTPEQEQEQLLSGYNKTLETGIPPDPPTEILIAGFREEDVVAKFKKVDELEEALNNRLQKVNNLVGNLKQRLDAIPKDTPKAELRAITADSMKKMRELGFDELADAIAEDLGSVLAVPEPPKIDVSGEVDKSLKSRALDELSDLHPDWRDLAEINESGEYINPEFADWFNTQDKDTQARIRQSNSVAFAARTLDRFKEWRDSKRNQQEEARQNSGDRLKNAVTPTQGKPAPSQVTLSDEAALWFGYNGSQPKR